MSESAASLKQQGNTHFKAGNLTKYVSTNVEAYILTTIFNNFEERRCFTPR